jgi:hypothetical protein
VRQFVDVRVGFDPPLDPASVPSETRAMNPQGPSRRTPWLLLTFGLALGLLPLYSLIDTSQASAVCLERAKYELVLCVAPPEAWQFVLSIGSGLFFAASAVKRGLAARS